MWLLISHREKAISSKDDFYAEQQLNCSLANTISFCPSALYLLSAQLTFRVWCVQMRWKWVNNATLTRVETPPPHNCSVRAWKGSRLRTCSTLAGSTRHAVYRRWPSKPLRPTWDYPGSGEPASTSPVDVCECMTFHKAFSVGLLCPRVMKPVSVDEQTFPGYRQNIAKWLIKGALRIGGCLRNRVQSQVLQIHHCPRCQL